MEELIRKVEHFGSAGSRILITSRDMQVLQNFGVNPCKIYEVKELPYGESLKLFSLYAFKENHPPIDYLELSKSIVTFVKGVPLALKVFGSMLFRKSKAIWESAVDNLERNTNREIHDVLKLSYDDLNNVEKNLFLDIACFYIGVKEDFVMEILNASKIGVSVLIDKCLINKCFDTITMHDLVREMGRKIVEEESKDPGNRSRLWDGKDIYRALTKTPEADAVEGICLDMSKIRRIQLRCRAFSSMHNLRFLDFYPSSKVKAFYRHNCLTKYYCNRFLFQRIQGECSCSYCSADEENENKVVALEGLEFNSIELMLLRWFGCSLKSLPSNFDPTNLRALIMPRSKIEHLGNDIQRFGELRHINLNYSKYLTKIPDMSLFPVLQSLILEGCSSLIELTSSRPCLSKLVILNLRGCTSLHSLPTSFQSESLGDILLSNCSNLEMAPEISGNVRRAYLDGTAIKELPLIKYPSRLSVLNLKNCSKLERLPTAMGELTYLYDFLFSGCSKLERLPEDLGNMKNFSSIVAHDTAIRELPSSIIHLKNLEELSLRGCKGQELVDSSLHLLSRCDNLSILDLSNCGITKLPENLNKLFNLKELNLSENKFDCMPARVKCLNKLKSLDVSYCERLQSLPELPRFLYQLQAHDCTLLEKLSDLSLDGTSFTARKVNLANCFNLDQDALKAKVNEALLKFLSDKTLLGLSLEGTSQIINFANSFKFPDYPETEAESVWDYPPFYSMQLKDPFGQAALCYPGNEIPEYFYQNMGSSITLKLPLDFMRKERCVQLVVCAIVTFPKYRITDETLPAVSYKCTTTDEDGNVMDQRWGDVDAWDQNDHYKTRYIEFDRVFLGHLTMKFRPLGKRDFFNGSLTIDFDVVARDDIQVKKCGLQAVQSDWMGDFWE